MNEILDLIIEQAKKGDKSAIRYIKFMKAISEPILESFINYQKGETHGTL